MFRQLKNIDSAFKFIRGFCLLLVTGSLLVCCYSIYKSAAAVTEAKQKIYILANGKILEAFAADRKDNIPVEARDHIKMFHQYFFTLDPDDKVIQYPFYFRCFGTEKIIRPTSTVTRDLITEGYLRNVSRSDNNPHGFLIERWNTIENKDIKIENR